MKKVSLASEDSQIDCKAVVITIDNREKTLFDFLGNVQDSREVHNSLVMPAQLAYASYHESLIAFPECLEYRERVDVVSKELRHQETE